MEEDRFPGLPLFMNRKAGAFNLAAILRLGQTAAALSHADACLCLALTCA